MSTTLSVLIALALLSVLGVLGLGLVSMVRGGQNAAKNANRLMRWRVGLQFLAVLLIVLAVVLAESS